jgi:hypothetical protein
MLRMVGIISTHYDYILTFLCISLGLIPVRSETTCLFEPHTICECIEIALGVCSIDDPDFYKLTSANFKAHILDRLMASFVPDESDRKLQVASDNT